jgi:hypothetical protein
MPGRSYPMVATYRISRPSVSALLGKGPESDHRRPQTKRPQTCLHQMQDCRARHEVGCVQEQHERLTGGRRAASATVYGLFFAQNQLESPGCWRSAWRVGVQTGITLPQPWRARASNLRIPAPSCRRTQRFNPTCIRWRAQELPPSVSRPRDLDGFLCCLETAR